MEGVTWTQLWNEEYKRHYYTSSDGRTEWVLPEGASVTPAAAVTATPSDAAADVRGEWRRVWSEEHARHYYLSTASGTSVWDAPPEWVTAATVVPAASGGWDKRWSDAHSTWYYVDKATGVSSWTQPDGYTAGEEMPAVSSAASPVAAGEVAVVSSEGGSGADAVAVTISPVGPRATRADSNPTTASSSSTQDALSTSVQVKTDAFPVKLSSPMLSAAAGGANVVSLSSYTLDSDGAAASMKATGDDAGVVLVRRTGTSSRVLTAAAVVPPTEPVVPTAAPTTGGSSLRKPRPMKDAYTPEEADGEPFTLSDFTGFAAHFMSIDSGKSGYITVPSMRAFSARSGVHLDDDALAELIADKDFNGDGRVSLREYIAAAMRPAPLQHDWFWTYVFQRYASMDTSAATPSVRRQTSVGALLQGSLRSMFKGAGKKATTPTAGDAAVPTGARGMTRSDLVKVLDTMEMVYTEEDVTAWMAEHAASGGGGAEPILHLDAFVKLMVQDT